MVPIRAIRALNSDCVSAESLRESIAPLQHSLIVPAASHSPDAFGDPALRAADVLVETLAELGVTHAFGINGGGIAPFSDALRRSPIQFLHFRQEVGAAFAAIEASLASGRPSLVMATTGPGLTNLYTGMVAARREGAKVVFISGCTSAAQRGRGAFQETSPFTGDMVSLFTPGPLFQFATMLDSAEELPAALSRIATGISHPGGFVAHLGLSMSVQTARLRNPIVPRLLMSRPGPCDTETVERCVGLLKQGTVVIWLGFGARDCADEIGKLVEATGAHVMCTPRGKGIFPEDSERFLGVTGLGGHDSVAIRMRELDPARVLVLGTRLGEFSSFWAEELAPREGFIHVDLDSAAFGLAYPSSPTLGVQSEIKAFLRALLDRLPGARPIHSKFCPRQHAPRHASSGAEAVRPSYLMHAVQKVIVEQSDAIILTEAGNSFTLTTHYLRFKEPGRYRVSTGFGAMGHAAAGVLGAALGSQRKAIAILGDGAMLMLNEINTAVTYGTNVVWIVLNDARYGMIAQGMQSIGWKPFGTDFARVDFAAVARAMGGDGVRVDREHQVEQALCKALDATGPFVVDVLIDPKESAPAGRRNASLVKQGVNRGSE